MALLLAAAIHDYDHPGLNNAFQVQTNSELALRYNDKSVLENHHCSAALTLIYKVCLVYCFNLFIQEGDKYNFMCNLSKEDQQILRQRIIDLVIATDLASHFDTLSQFKTKISSGVFNKYNSDDRLILMKIALKIADIGNTAKPAGLYLKWVERITEEFFRFVMRWHC